MVVDSNASQRGLVEISLVSPPPLSPTAIKRLIVDARCDLHAKKLPEICITGQGSVEVYTALAFEAVRAGAQSLSCFAPRFGQLQVYSSTQCDDCPPAGALLPLNNWLQERLAIRLHGHVTGVAGDPNTGKSVFSTVLDYHRRQAGAAGWRLDCDAQAPTPPWYLQSRAGGLGVEADALRSTLKRDWTPHMELLLADQLKNMRSSLPVSIADLPGGNHKADPPQRLPPGRERLFEPIDALIVLEASDRRTAEQWRMELAGHALSERIRAVVTSTAPNSTPRLTGHTVDGVWQGVAQGLDRAHSIRDLHQGFLPALDELWRVISATS